MYGRKKLYAVCIFLSFLIFAFVSEAEEYLTEDLLEMSLDELLNIIVFTAKAGFFAFLFLWVRWTLPRFRYDQLMRLGWKTLLPLGILNIFITGLINMKL